MGEFQGVAVGAADVSCLISVKPPRLGNCSQELVKALAHFEPKAICTLSQLEAPSDRGLAL